MNRGNPIHSIPPYKTKEAGPLIPTRAAGMSGKHHRLRMVQVVQVIDFARMIELRRDAGDSELDKTTAILREIQNASRGF